MLALPIDRFLPDILAQLREQRRLVIVAEPGAGKTTRVPPAIIRSGLLLPPHDRLIMLQPRRVAARAAAARIAHENLWQLGREVGYQVRGDNRISRDTRLQIATEAILTRRILADPFLEGVGCVVLDEFHERHIDSDLCLSMLAEICSTVRDDLYIVVMSATLDAQAVSGFLGHCPIINIPGRLFPVNVSFAAPPAPAMRNTLQQHIAAQMRRILDEAEDSQAEDPGDILVFLPGIEEIRRVGHELEPLAQSRDIALLPLHGALTVESQSRVLEPLSQRKIILSTNIAETSLTIDGVRTVIDAGLARIPVYDARRGMDRLELRRISRASATQRTGRAGRTAPGRCIRLWSAAEDRNLKPFEAPEVHRVDLASPILQLHQWGKSDPRAFNWFQPPPDHMISAAESLLSMLGALSAPANGSITPLGERMLEIGAHPRLARLMIEASRMGFVAEAAAIAALLSEKDILVTATELNQRRTRDIQGRSDILHRLELLRIAEQSGFARSLRDQMIDPSSARQVARSRDDLIRSFQGDRTGARTASEDDLLKLVLLAYPDRLCVRRENNPDSAAMVGGFGVKIDPASIVVQPRLFIAVDARDDTRRGAREAVSRILSEVQPEWLQELFPHLLSTDRQVQIDPATSRAVARIITRFVDLPIREQIDHSADSADLSAALASLVQTKAREIIASDPRAAQLLERISFLRHHMPERQWPDFTDETLGEILSLACANKRSIDQLKQEDLAELLLANLEWKLRQQIDEFAPETVTVPSGSHIRLEYAGARQPTLSVRLQEVFSWLETPRIAAGRVPLVLELLGPNYRPVQVTSDLASFWKTTYFQVRKDLRVRYPKHAWPEDPLTAKPEAKGRPRRT